MTQARFSTFFRLARPAHEPADSRLRGREGKSMFEMLGVIVLGTILAITGVEGYNFGMTLLNTQSLTSQLHGLVMGVRDLKGARAGYGTSSYEALLISSGRAPAGTVSGTTLLNTFGGTWTVTGQTGTFTVETNALPDNICIKAASITGGTSVEVNGQLMTMVDGSVDPVDADAECSGDANTIVWTFN